MKVLNPFCGAVAAMFASYSKLSSSKLSSSLLSRPTLDEPRSRSQTFADKQASKYIDNSDSEQHGVYNKSYRSSKHFWWGWRLSWDGKHEEMRLIIGRVQNTECSLRTRRLEMFCRPSTTSRYGQTSRR